MIAPIKQRLGLSTPLTLSQREAVQGLIYISPWIIGFLVFTVGPMIASAYLSLTNYNMVTPPRFAGLNNYEYMFSDRLFWKSIGNTLYYTIIFVPIAIAGSLALAILLNQKIAGRVALRTLYFLPSVTPVVAAAFLWLWIFQPQIGLMNSIISALGLGNGPLWLSHPGSSKQALIIISLWGALGGNTMLIFLAALQGIPKELYESADIDGAGGVAKVPLYYRAEYIAGHPLQHRARGDRGAADVYTGVCREQRSAAAVFTGRTAEFDPVLCLAFVQQRL